MIPLYDENPRRSVPVMTLALIAANVVVFLWQATAGLEQYTYAMVPSLVTGAGPGMIRDGNDVYRMAHAAIPAWMTIFTSMFMHGGIMHIAGNMLYLWIFGDNIEENLGKVRFLLFYLACGVIASVAHIMMGPSSPIPTVGASGAIAGVMGGYILLHPNVGIKALIPLGLYSTITTVPAWVMLGLWFAYQLVLQMLDSGQGGGVAYAAHVGGFIAGLVLVKMFAVGRPTQYAPDNWTQ